MKEPLTVSIAEPVTLRRLCFVALSTYNAIFLVSLQILLTYFGNLVLGACNKLLFFTSFVPLPPSQTIGVLLISFFVGV